MEVAVTGSTGLVGTALVPALEARGHRVARVVRPESDPPPGARTIAWDVRSGTIDAAAFEGIDAVVHLAGVGLGERRWTPATKAQILRSRTEGTGLVAHTLAQLDRPPRVLLSASAIGIYGVARGDEVLGEDDPGSDDDFLSATCQRWESATAPAAEAGVRVTLLRSGIVLARDGGALARQLLPYRLGLGGRLGSGRQWMSWISLTDQVRAITHLLGSDAPVGPVNLVAPKPVRQQEFAETLGAVLHRPTVLPTPVFALRLRYGSELVDTILLCSQRVSSAKLESSGFQFEHETLEAALRAELDIPA